MRRIERVFECLRASPAPHVPLRRQRKPWRTTLSVLIGPALVISMALDEAALANPQATGISIQRAWARATPADATVGAAYFEIIDRGDADTLIHASTPIAKHVEFHSSRVENGMMQMRELSRVVVAAHGKVIFRPGTLHAMLVELSQPLRKGEHFPLTLVFQRAGEIQIDVVVRGLHEADADGR